MEQKIEVPPQNGKPYNEENYLDRIRRRYDRAEYAAAHVFNNAAFWYKYYGDTADRDPFIADFKFIMRLNEKLLGEVSELRYRLESAGVDPDKETA